MEPTLLPLAGPGNFFEIYYYWFSNLNHIFGYQSTSQSLFWFYVHRYGAAAASNPVAAAAASAAGANPHALHSLSAAAAHGHHAASAANSHAAAAAAALSQYGKI